MRRKYGFTLVEVLFVVLIAAGVMAFSVPAYQKMKQRSAYDKALGALVDMGNAVTSLERDLKVSTGVSVKFPWNPATWTIPNMSYAFSPGTEKSWNEWLTSDARTSASNEWNQSFWAALFYFNYLKAGPSLGADGYTYCFMGGVSLSTASCSSYCASSSGTVRVCMYQSENPSGCYLGAVFLEGGKVERLVGNDCK